MKPKIHLLTPHIAERIAAGEVIERPASVVKELVENSLDAGATEVAVQLEDGGKSLIEVLDNGHGMPYEDLALCIERHATSKLSSLEDLEKISTLGFRGEALPSIAAVSDLSIISRSKDEASAFELSVGDISSRHERKPAPVKTTFGHFINAPHGTRIQARGIFSQVPARLKFLKSQGAEVAQVREWLDRLALAYPNVGFRLVSDDRTVLNLRPQSEQDRVRTILGEGDDYPIISNSNEQDGFRDVGLKIRIHWLQGLSSPNSRKLVQVVNSRAVRDRLLQQAVLAPFRQTLLPGQFPAIALFVEVNPAALDVNVHPTKSEIRFLDNRKIFHSIETVIKSMIIREGAPAIAPMPARYERFSPQNETAAIHLAQTPTPSSPPPPYVNSNWQASEQNLNSSPSPVNNASGGPHYTNSNYQTRSYNFTETPHEYKPLSLFSSEMTNPLGNSSKNPLNSARHVGILFNTYLAYEQGSELVLVDQHAAHERIRYEALKKRTLGSQTVRATLSSQSLLIPESVRFSAENRALLESRLTWLGQLGFEAEIFGEEVILFRAVPAEWGLSQLKSRLKNLVDRIISVEVEESPETSSGSTPGAMMLDESLFEALASEACHSAIRAGDHLESEEVQDLVNQLFQCEHPWNCPHGRPTVVRVPQGKLEEWFQRRV